MNWNIHEENNLRRYLLNDLPVAERWEVERRLILDSDYDELAQLIEQELIDDYACGVLNPTERALFETSFPLTPERRASLLFARQAVAQATTALQAEPTGKADANQPQSQWKTQAGSGRIRAEEGGEWWRQLFAAPRLRFGALAALLLLASGVGAWLAWSRTAESPAADLAISRAAVAGAATPQRPFQPRLSDLAYTPASQLMGAAPRTAGALALERAEHRWRRWIERRPTVEAYYELGRVYLMKREFTLARAQFDAALRLAAGAEQNSTAERPRQAKLHNDLGVTLFELWRVARVNDPPPSAAALEQKSLAQFTTALALDDRLLEARFNRALLYQQAEQPEQARAAWDDYLARETDPHWIEEAKQNRETLR